MNAPFSSLALKPELLTNLETLKYLVMTPIQSESLPAIIDGKDVIGQAKTGSGKTAAFGLGLLQRLNVGKFWIQCLVLCPTRELADQVAIEIRQLARGIHNVKVLTLCGGMPFGPQKGSLEHGAHIIVGTPGRIEDHLRKGTLDLSQVQTFVLDEADRMLDMGFLDAVDRIHDQLPSQRQTLLFSATFPQDIKLLSQRVTQGAAHVKVDAEHDAASILQLLYRMEDRDGRTHALMAILNHHQPGSALVFCNTKQLTLDVSAELRSQGYSAQALNGDLDQKDRGRRLLCFANGSLSVLVATDVAARGLDIESLDLVVNYHLPKDPEVHTHRVGRTGRAGSIGIACSISVPGEDSRIELLEGMTGTQFKRIPVPDLPPSSRPSKPAMVSLQIDGGKKHKLRPGDIVGALTANTGIPGDSVGKINVTDNTTVVAVARMHADKALAVLKGERIKGKSFKARIISDRPWSRGTRTP